MTDQGRSADRAALEALHRRVCDADASATDELCATALPRLRARLRRLRPRADHAAIECAAEDAIMKYLGHPQAYEPNRAGLLTWLEAIALRRLVDYERPDRRGPIQVAAGIDLTRLDRPLPMANAAGVTEEWITEHRARLLAAARTDAERAFVEARLAGALREEQARALGVAHLPLAEARAEMNRVWELICRRARRSDRPPERGT